MKVKTVALSIGLILLIGGGVFIGMERKAEVVPTEVHKVDILDNTAHYPITIETLNSKGELREETFSYSPQRVVAIWQNSIETLIALGVGDRIVGVAGLPNSSYLREEYRPTYEAILYKKPVMLDWETVRMLEPDLIVGWYSSFGKKTLKETDFWDSRNVGTYIAMGSYSGKENRTFSDECTDIENLGKIFDREKEADTIVRDIQQKINKAKKKAEEQGRKPRGLIIELMGRSMRVYGKKSLAGDLLKEMGGELVGEDLTQIGKEELVALDPDVVFLVVIESDYDHMDTYPDQLYNDKGLQEMRFIQDRKIYVLPLYTIYSAGVRISDGIDIIGQGLYGES